MIITARGSSNLALTILWLHSIYIYSCVTAQTVKYGVYFDTTNGSPNPFGDGYYPQSQKFWSLVDSASYPIFLNWGKYLEDPSKWNNGNQCKDRSSATYGTNHRQSPIKLQKDDTFIDRHRTRVLDPGVCAKDEARFYTTPYGLGVDTTKCNRYWWYDHSLNPDPWYLQEIRIITPSEHTVLKSTGETQYVGELQLAFKGTVDHKAKIAITGIFLAVNPSGKADAEVEKLLVGWEAYQSNVYRNCNKAFNSQTCSLVPTSNPISAPMKPKPVPVPTKPLKPVPAPTKPKLAPQVKPVPLPTKKPKTRKLEECWTGGGCPGSYYCFPELYWQATDGNGSHHHWRYSGSLTYPPCTENVEWRVMFGTLQISQSQLDLSKP